MRIRPEVDAKMLRSCLQGVADDSVIRITLGGKALEINEVWPYNNMLMISVIEMEKENTNV